MFYQYKFLLTSDDDYKTHQILKGMFPGEGKLIFKQQDNNVICITNIPLMNEILYLEESLSINDIINDNILNKTIELKISLNPTKNLYKKKIALKSNNEIYDYLIKKLNNIGINFNFNDIKIMRHYVKKCNRKNCELKFNAIDICVSCIVNNIETFKYAIENGVGSCKMCGFGFVEMQPVY